MDSYDSITHYAVLVGIDDYPIQPLKSAASDAQEAQRLLDSKLKDCVKIYSLIADPYHNNLATSIQEPTLRPTLGNFVNVLNTIIRVANPGSFVYIHFSGHGTRKVPEEEKEPIDVGLVLLNEDDPQGLSVLWGEELADLIKLMVNKTLAVTIVLDCCYSGAIYRRDSEVRYLPYDAKIDLWEKQIQRDSLEAQSHSPYRDISFLPNWLVNPKGYAIITACGPHQKAASAEFNGQANGILSYYVFETLKYIDFARSLKTVYGRLCTKIRSCKFDHSQNQMNKQDPLLYGNKDQAFFGSLELNSAGINIPVIKREDGAIELQAGHAHGISVGNEFALFPAKGETMSKLIARASRCHGLTSILEILDPSTKSARTGWLARVRSQSWLHRIPIRLASDIPDKPLWLSAMETRSLKAHDGMSEWRVGIELMLDSGGQYQVLDENGSNLANLPAMPQNQVIPDEVCDILEHLVRFQVARDLTNEASAIDYLDNVEISIRCDGKSYGPTANIAMKHGTIAEVIVMNNRDKPVFVFVYDLGPSWQVEQLFGGSYYLVNPKNTIRKKFRMTVPERLRNQGHETCKDILKIIITSQPTSFDVLELPRLREFTRRKGLEANRSTATEQEEWVATNFFIRTSMEEKTAS